MRRELWPEVESLFATAIKLAEDERLAYVERSSSNLEVRGEVESMLAAHGPALGFLLPDAPPSGRRFGSYRITGELGRGGMGAVFLAERDDDQFQKQVAIKVIAVSAENPEMLRRFRSERQILATLEHPNIARLLDSGVSNDGLPFIVMEYIEGTPITVFCRSRPLDQRLKLFETVCVAVHFAHQHLVVHRDIKPGNILVTTDGIPKLLDFGVAKIVDPPGGAPGDMTATVLRPLTPDYASPEELAGGAVSTAGDVYSLGVVLFELITGERPGRLAAKPGDEIRIPPGIPSDLSWILRKAMRREPLERYAAASELAADVERYLTQRPVAARRGTFRYTARKFVQRHRTVAAAAAVAVLLLVASALALAHSARVAEAERLKAQQRFEQVRTLANSLVFEIHDGIAALPGSTAVRKTLVARALEYLDTLEKGSSGDIGLELELSRSYSRLGSVQGNPASNNLGDLQGALASYARAAGILQRVLAAAPGRPDALSELGWLHLMRGAVRNHLRKLPERDAELARALEICDQLTKRFPNDERTMKLRAALLSRLADARAEQDTAAGRDLYLQALALDETLLRARPGDLERQRSVALVHKYLANLIPSDAEALEHLRQAQALDEGRVAAQPDSALAKLDLSFDLSDIGWRTERTGDLPGALGVYRKVVIIRQALADADPHDSWVRTRLIFSRKRVADVLAKMGALHAALVDYRAAIELAKVAAAAAPADRPSRGYLADLELGLASAEGKLGHRVQSCEAYRRASDVFAALAAEGTARLEERKKAETASQAVAGCDRR
jgi:non-specific serine/threonine protein kinase/serine/threonine-protein kinase